MLSELDERHLGSYSDQFVLSGDEMSCGNTRVRPTTVCHPRHIRRGLYRYTESRCRGDSIPMRTHGSCAGLGVVNVNPYRWALDTCEPSCGRDVCREYGDRLARWMDSVRGSSGCRERQRQPKNPRDNGCENGY